MSNEPAPDQSPVTGHPQIDAALTHLDLGGPVAEQVRALVAVQELLHEVLNGPQRPSR